MIDYFWIFSYRGFPPSDFTFVAKSYSDLFQNVWVKRMILALIVISLTPSHFYILSTGGGDLLMILGLLLMQNHVSSTTNPNLEALNDLFVLICNSLAMKNVPTEDNRRWSTYAPLNLSAVFIRLSIRLRYLIYLNGFLIFDS